MGLTMGNLQRPQASPTAKTFPPCDARVKNLSSPLYFPDTTFGSDSNTISERERDGQKGGVRWG